MRHFLDFEKPIAELEGKIEELRRMSEPGGINIADEVGRLTAVADKQLRATYAKLTPWQKTQVARHPDRPKARDYIETLITEFTPLAGDRAFADDAAVLGGMGRFRGNPVMVLGTEKGSDTESRVKHNFGMARPEGYRKARRLIELAGRFHMPVLTFIDTAGAYPGIDAEARGQAEAIARSIETCLQLRVPLVAAIIGEGGSGGALALAAANRVLMLEHSTYSVISPEACSSIIWRSGENTQDAAEALKLTAQDLLKLGVKTDPPIMTGTVAMKTKLSLPPGPADVANRLKLAGTFHIPQGFFTNEKLQGRIDSFSMRSLGKHTNQNDQEMASVRSDLQGKFTLNQGLLSFSFLHFQIPGTHADMTGDYSLDGNTFDFHGLLRLDAKLSQMTTGWKSILLKPVDPFFQKHGAGTEVPFKVTGTRSEPHFGLDFGHKDEQPPKSQGEAGASR